MSKLPERPPESGFVGTISGEGLKSKSGNQERLIVSAHGIHLEPSDFSDLLLPSLLFSDEKGTTHELSINALKQLIIDEQVVADLSNFYTKTEVDKLVNEPIYTSPNGTKWGVKVSDDGKLETIKKNGGN